MFEFTIRFVGGLLSIYALTGDKVSSEEEKEEEEM